MSFFFYWIPYKNTKSPMTHRLWTIFKRRIMLLHRKLSSNRFFLFICTFFLFFFDETGNFVNYTHNNIQIGSQGLFFINPKKIKYQQQRLFNNCLCLRCYIFSFFLFWDYFFQHLPEKWLSSLQIGKIPIQFLMFQFVSFLFLRMKWKLYIFSIWIVYKLFSGFKIAFIMRIVFFLFVSIFESSF